MRAAAKFLTAAFGVVLTGLAPSPPESPLDWAWLAGGAMLTAYAGVSSLVRGGGSPPEPPDTSVRERLRWCWGWVRRNWPPVVAFFGVALLLAIGVPPLAAASRALTYSVSGCPPATQLRLIADPETIGTARELAADYERWAAGRDHGCPPVQIYAYTPSDASTIVRALANPQGWRDSRLLDKIGPQPDIWLASTGHQVDLVDDLMPTASPVLSSTTIARSPVVLAVPAAAAQEDQPPSTWQELLQRFGERGPGVARSLPADDDLDVLATIPLYESGAVDGQQLPPAEIERRIRAGLDAGGFDLTATDALQLLCRRRHLGQPGPGPRPAWSPDTALVVTEQQLIRYNLGEPLGINQHDPRGESCGSGIPEPPPEQWLTALYPTDSVAQDLQLVRLAGGSAAQQRAVRAFQDWLTGSTGTRAIARAGFRPVSGDLADLPAAGTDPSQAPPLGPVDRQRWVATNTALQQARRPNTVLIAVDRSGSMGVAEPDGSRQQLAVRAIIGGLRDLGPEDRFGLWAFPGDTATGHTELLGIDDWSPDRVVAAEQRLGLLAANGTTTPLFTTMVDGVQAVSGGIPQGTDDRRFQALVMLTDGDDTEGAIGPDEVVRVAAARGVRVVVLTVGRIRCSSPELVAIASTTNACLDADSSDLDAKVAQAVAGLKGGS